jgi:DNA-directed RNA polymerase sigma subunit (sigma70/sigma32)
MKLLAPARAENHFGLSYVEVGKRLGISPVRVRQIEQRALAKLRAGLLKVGVKTSDVGDLRDSAA